MDRAGAIEFLEGCKNRVCVFKEKTFLRVVRLTEVQVIRDPEGIGFMLAMVHVPGFLPRDDPELVHHEFALQPTIWEDLSTWYRRFRRLPVDSRDQIDPEMLAQSGDFDVSCSWEYHLSISNICVSGGGWSLLIDTVLVEKFIERAKPISDSLELMDCYNEMTYETESNWYVTAR